MLVLQTADACDADATICRATLDLTGSEAWAKVADVLIGKPLIITTIVVVGLLVRWVLHRLVDRVVARAERGVLPGRMAGLVVGGSGRGDGLRPGLEGATRRVQRAQAMGSLLKSIVTGVVAAVLITTVLGEIGVDIAPIIASAGIIGIALGFGSQSLVKDFLAGIFMIFEDQYGVGDVIDLGTATGTVEAVSLRVTRLRDVNGTVWYVRNGEILRVGNQSQNWSRAVLDVPVALGEDLARVRKVLQEVAHDLWEDEDYKGLVVEEPEVWGVETLDRDGMTVRVTLKTAPLEQWRVAREMRQRIKARFDHEGIQLLNG